MPSLRGLAPASPAWQAESKSRRPAELQLRHAGPERALVAIGRRAADMDAIPGERGTPPNAHAS